MYLSDRCTGTNAPPFGAVFLCAFRPAPIPLSKPARYPRTNAMTTYIHIGLQKTGTTFLQRSMNRCRSELRKHGVIYPGTAAGLGENGPAGHHFISAAILERQVKFIPTTDFSRLDTHVDAVKEQIRRGNGTGVISSELFSHFNAPHVGRLRTLFPEPDVKIVVYLRRQDAWLDSLYGQMIKVGRKMSIAEFEENKKTQMDFYALVSLWGGVFGKENIIVRTYEKADSHWIWRDFLESIGATEAAAITPPTEMENQSLPHELTLFARNLPNYNTDRTMRRLLESLADQFPAKHGLKYLDEARARQIMDGHAEINARVAREYCRRDQLFADQEPLPSVGQDELTPEQYASIQGAISIKLLDRLAKVEREVRDLETINALPLWPLRYLRRRFQRR